MDLAKIRQKARQIQESQQSADIQQQPIPAAIPVPAQVLAVQPSDVSDDDYFADIPPSVSQLQPPLYRQEIVSVYRPTPRSPLDVILAGREAAGCDEELPLSAVDHEQAVIETYQEFLCFRVSDEIYGINIMDIKELIKPREVTEVPRAPSFVLGVISLRGTIIPIIDMLERLGLKHATATGRERVIVVRHEESFSGLLVDEIIQVVRIAQECLENTPTVLDGIDREFVSGIGRADGRMIILLNLANIVDINLY
jgi:purine-binding chemotaxis protein CheW